MKEDKNIEAFLAEIRSSYDKKEFQEKKRTKLLLGYCFGMSLFCLASVGLNYYLFPLKQTQPIIAIVDGNTGIVNDVQYYGNDTEPEKIEVLIKSYAFSYVIGRYSYNYRSDNPGTLREQYARVSVFSNDEVNKAFLAEISPNNPNSPFSTLKETGTIEVKINNISIFDNDRVQVQFKTTIRNGKTEQVFSYTAIGKYILNDYAGLSVSDKWLNPFGFKFTSWNITQNASSDALETRPVQTPQPTDQPPQHIQSSEVIVNEAQ